MTEHETKLKLLDAHIAELKKIKRAILENDGVDRKIDRLKEAYALTKDNTPALFSDDKEFFGQCFIGISKCLQDIENSIPNRFLFDLPDFKLGAPLLISKTSPEEILDTIVQNVRGHLYKKSRTKKSLPLNQVDLQNFCRYSKRIVSFLCMINRIPFKSYKIEPGFIKNSKLYYGGGWHWFNIATIGNRDYLIDCIYSQFFLETRCLHERLGILFHPSPDAGTFMTFAREEVAKKILYRGWIELERDNLKHYLDGFACSIRNGLYYEKRTISRSPLHTQ